MSKTQVKPVQTIEKVKKAVAKKAVAKKVLADKPKPNTKAAPKPKVVVVPNKNLDKLHAHAMKHLANWHSKAGVDGAEFAKRLVKDAKTLLK